MELAHSLLLNEEALTKIPDAKRPVFIFEWLRFLDKVLVAAQKVKFDIFSLCIGLASVSLKCIFVLSYMTASSVSF